MPVEPSRTLKRSRRRIRELASGPIARASALSLVIRVAGLGLSFAQAVLTARLLGAEGYGTIAVAMAVVQVVGTICVFGLPSLAVREIPAAMASGDFARTAAFLRYSLVAVLAFSATVGTGLAIVAGATQWVSPEYRMVLEIGALLLLPGAILALIAGSAQGFGRVVLTQVPVQLMRPAAMVLVMAVVATAGLSFSPVDYMWSVVGAVLLTTIAAGAWLWRSDLRHLSLTLSSAPVAGHFAAALPFLGLAIASILQGEINTLLLGWFAGPNETGLFQPIMRLAPVILLPVEAAGIRYAPRVSEFWSRGETHRIRSVTATFTWTTSLLTLAIALAIGLAGPWLMRAFGAEFQQSARLVWVVCAAQVFNSACGPVAILLSMSRRSGWTLAGHLLGVIVNLALGVLLIPLHGAWGATIAMAGGIVVWNVTLMAMVKAQFGFDPSLAGALFRVKAVARPNG
jgi:O-antigen/teichoic acid export membrane protein